MTTLTRKPPVRRSRSAASRPELDAVLLDLPPGGSAYFDSVPWDDYDRLLHLRDEERPGIRLTFDRGELELMTVTFPHESWKSVLSDLIKCYVEETGGVMCCAGNLTVRRKDLLKGLEPDDCYYIRNAARVIPPRDLDFAVDPPPDLAIEVEKSRTVLKRLPVYAALGVPEVWRFNGSVLTILHRGTDGKYSTDSKSRTFPKLDLVELVRFARMLDSVDQTTIVRRFRAWVRKKYKSSNR
jgi:Uma2 family endonuclease